jgi:molybdopterin/thiamine biosynthesis adenylyltransferase
MKSTCNDSRQIAYWGKASQEKINQATVAIIGVGGLGSLVAELLCRMGVGTLLLCDDDVVADHNLSRQHLYTLADIGEQKTHAAKKQLEQINKQTNITCITTKASKENLDWSLQADIIIDCTDRHESRREIDAFCQEHQKPWIHGAAVEEKGAVFVFLPEHNIRYNDIYGSRSTNYLCKDIGVLATTTTFVGTLQASFAAQFIIGKSVPNTLLRIDARLGTIEHITISQKAL